MGTYLFNGIVRNITTRKSEVKQKHIAIATVTEALRKELNIDYYNHTEDSNYHYWNIKPEMLTNNLTAFLDAQFQMYRDKKDKEMQEVINKITSMKTAEEIIALADAKIFSYFQSIDASTHIKVMRDNGFSELILVQYSLISYFMDGKIIMECYKDIFKYFETNIRSQRDKYPIVDCIKIMIND
jgi:hypothetical protein